MAVSEKGRGKGIKIDDSDERRRGVSGKGKKVVLGKGKKVVSDDDDEEDYDSEESLADEKEEDEAEHSSGDDIRITRKKMHKRVKEQFELDEDDYDLLEEANVTGFRHPSNLGGKFKRLKKADHVHGRKDSGAAVEEMSEDEETEEDEDGMVDEENELEDETGVDEDRSFFKYGHLQKRRARKVQSKSTVFQKGAQWIYKGSRPSVGSRRKRDRNSSAVINEESDDSDENDGNDQETLARKFLEKQFEPSPLEAHNVIARDDRLRSTDIPERIQVLEEVAGPLPRSIVELRRASEWIFDRAFGHLCLYSRSEFQHLLNMDKYEVVKQIANVLHLVHNEKLEIPFIAMYRREECLDLLKELTDEVSHEDRRTIYRFEALWAVHEWNKKWLILQRRKSDLQDSYEMRIPIGIIAIPEKDNLFKRILRSLADAESEQAVGDCEAQFNLHFPTVEVDMVDRGFKRPKCRSSYSCAHDAGLGSITKYFGLTSEAFGDNLKAGHKMNEILDEAFLPDDIASKFCNESGPTTQFRDPASILRGARHMLAVEISTEPSVRECVRMFYSKNATVNTRPTPAGMEIIDAFHQFEGVKLIKDKQISAFDDEQWLLIHKAEAEKLIDVTVGVSKESIDTFLSECEPLFSSDGSTCTSQHWNEQRKQILQEATVTILLSKMEKEARMNLVTNAKRVVVAQCVLQLWNKVSIGPYDPAKGSGRKCRNEEGSALRVLACCWGPASKGTTFVMLDADGEILNILHTGYLSTKVFTPEQAQRKENDQSRLLQVLIDFKPHIVVLGAATVQCQYLYRDISDVLFRVVERHAGDLAGRQGTIKLVYGDESIPILYETSRISQIQLPGQPGVVRRAVGLGRYLQNPVAMLASLCGPEMDILSVKFHSLQSFLSNEELYDVIERVVVTVTNQVGLDINRAITHDWLFETLPFVAGLGPRKAGAIKRTIQMKRRVLFRDDLYLTIQALGEKVFKNSAGFIRVRPIEQTSSEVHHLEPLDNTRIHPEWYQTARNFAEAVIEKDPKRNDGEIDCDSLNMAVEHVMKNPDLLDTMVLEDFAECVQDDGNSNSIQTLELIKSELQHGFQECRKVYLEPSKEECFYLMSGEREETLFPGRIVQATIRKVQDNQVMCVLESGLVGFIYKEDLSDHCDAEPKERITEGSLVTCRVKNVNMEKFLIYLTCKESDFRRDFYGDLHHDDKPKTTLLSEQEKIRKENEDQHKKTFKLRPIVHPKFQNISADDAIKSLAEKDVGDFTIRPSCKGPAHLSITLKLSDDLFSHIDIAESDKEHWDLNSFLRLGKTLTIEDESYKDLDEVEVKYVSKLVTHLHAMLQFRKYKQGTKVEITDALRSEKTEKPKSIPYCFSLSHEYPGAFMLSYMKATTPFHEYISLFPSGFRFRKKVFDTIDKLVVYFQNHFHDRVPEVSSKMRTWGEEGRGRGGRRRDDRGRGRNSRGRGREDSHLDNSGELKWRRPLICRRCYEEGHKSMDCPDKDTPCEKCDSLKHRTVACGVRCGICSFWGHFDKECTNRPTGEPSTNDADGGHASQDDGVPRRTRVGRASQNDWEGRNWNNGDGNDNLGDDHGTAHETNGGDTWNDRENGRNAAWGIKSDIVSNKEGECNAWKNSTIAPGGGGDWGSWNEPPDGVDAAKNAGSRGEDAGWGQKGENASDIDGEINTEEKVTNPAGRADRETGKGESDNVEGDNIKSARSDGAWDSTTESTGGDDGGVDVPASVGGWDAVEGGHNDFFGNQSGVPDEDRDVNLGGGGERTRRCMSDLSSSPARRPESIIWKISECTSDIDFSDNNQRGGKSASDTTTTDCAWGSATDAAGSGIDGGCNTVPESKSGSWDAVQDSEKGRFGSQNIGAAENWNQTGRDHNVALSEERSTSPRCDSSPAETSHMPVQNTWEDQNGPPASIGVGCSELVVKERDATVVSGGDSGWTESTQKIASGEDSGWGVLNNEATETAGADWSSVADPWGSEGFGGLGQKEAAAESGKICNDEGWNSSQTSDGQGSNIAHGRWANQESRGAQNNGGRWEGRGGRGPRSDGDGGFKSRRPLICRRCYVEGHKAIECPDKDTPCGKCNRLNHRTIACGVRCGSCNYWGHFDEECTSRPSRGVSTDSANGGRGFQNDGDAWRSREARVSKTVPRGNSSG